MFLFEKKGRERSRNLLDKLWNTLNALSSKKTLKYTLYLSAIIIFLMVILVPPIIGIIVKTPTIQEFLNHPELTDAALVAILYIVLK